MALISLVTRLQRDEEPAEVDGAGAANAHGNGRNIGISQHDLAELFLVAKHVGKRDVLGRFRLAGDQAGVLLRKEAFRDCREEETVQPAMVVVLAYFLL